MSKIEVEISGLRGSGKSAVMSIIANTLKLYGYSVHFNDMNTRLGYRPEVLNALADIKYSNDKTVYLTEKLS